MNPMRTRNRHDVLLLAVLVAAAATTRAPAVETDRAAASAPNVILIISDDQAYTDFGFMGHPVVRTPHLDRLAEQSARFPNGYVPSSLCRPSLATLLTGLYPHQHLIHFNDPPDKRHRQEAERLIRAVPTLPRWLAQVGYKSLQTGKFWEGNFRNAGFTEGMTHGDPNRVDKHPTLGLLRGRHGDLGLTIGRDSMQPIFEFIDRCGDDPFFVWYAPFLPHEPHNPPEKYLKLYEGKDLHPRIAAYYAMCSWLDDTVGQLMHYLDAKGLSENTLIVFVVDNGWITDTSRPHGFAPRSKRSPFEMGIRTPVLLRWPGRIPPATYDTLVSSVDLAPTILAAARVTAEEVNDLPGENLLPLCEGAGALERDVVFGDVYEHDASALGRPAGDLLYRWVRAGPWKLIDAAEPSAPDMLFQLADDPQESVNRIDSPSGRAKAAELRRRLERWWTPE
jgi:arylsulfatase A-like enzyme